MKARSYSWLQTKYATSLYIPTISVIFFKKNPLKNLKSECITNWTLPNHFTNRLELLIPIVTTIQQSWQLAKNISITKYYFPRITKISAHLGMHASQTRCTIYLCKSQWKLLNKNTRTHSVSLSKLTRSFCIYWYARRLILFFAPRIFINEPTSGWMFKYLATLHRRLECLRH